MADEGRVLPPLPPVLLSCLRCGAREEWDQATFDRARDTVLHCFQVRHRHRHLLLRLLARLNAPARVSAGSVPGREGPQCSDLTPANSQDFDPI